MIARIWLATAHRNTQGRYHFTARGHSHEEALKAFVKCRDVSPMIPRGRHSTSRFYASNDKEVSVCYPMDRIAFTAKGIPFTAARLWLVAMIWVLVSGCREGADQAAEEYSAASCFLSRMQSHENRFPDIPITNLQQVVGGVDAPYPARLHHQFRRFGKHAGFKNSFLEKYVLVPNRFTNGTVGGDIVLLNAEPFPDRDNRHGRVLIFKWKSGWDGWGMKWYPEEQVQEIFRAAGQSIPKAIPMPPPSNLAAPSRPPLSVRVEEYFGDITKSLGIGTNAGKYLMWITFALAAVVLTVLSLVGWRKWR